MLTTSQRSCSLIALLLFFCSSNPLHVYSHHRSPFPDQGYSYPDTTKTFSKKKSETSSVFGVCAAAVCLVGAVVFGGILLSELFTVSDENFLRASENRYYDIKNGYGRMLHGHLSNDDLEDHIIVHATYRILSYKRQLEADINQLSNDRKGVAQRIRTLAKKLQGYNEDEAFNYTLARATKRSLEALHDKQTALLEQLRTLLVRVVRLPRCQKEEKEKRKDERERERINAMNRPKIHVHNRYCEHNCHHSSSSVSVVIR